MEKTKIPRRKLDEERRDEKKGVETQLLLEREVRSPPRVEGRGGDRGATPRYLNRYSKPQGENARLRQGLSRFMPSRRITGTGSWWGKGRGGEREATSKRAKVSNSYIINLSPGTRERERERATTIDISHLDSFSFSRSIKIIDEILFLDILFLVDKGEGWIE